MHSEFTVEDVEKEFLSILVLKPQMAFDLLQIKPNYFSNSKYSAITLGILIISITLFIFIIVFKIFYLLFFIR